MTCGETFFAYRKPAGRSTIGHVARSSANNKYTVPQTHRTPSPLKPPSPSAYTGHWARGEEHNLATPKTKYEEPPTRSLNEKVMTNSVAIFAQVCCSRHTEARRGLALIFQHGHYQGSAAARPAVVCGTLPDAARVQVVRVQRRLDLRHLPVGQSCKPRPP